MLDTSVTQIFLHIEVYKVKKNIKRKLKNYFNFHAGFRVGNSNVSAVMASGNNEW